MATISKHDEKDDDSIPFFPDHALTEYWVALGILGILIVVGALGQLYPIGLEEPADPMNTPLHAKPEWYFLFLYQMLKYVPKTVGVLIPIVGLLVLMIWPFLDRGTKNPKRARLLRIIGVAIFLVAAAILTILGALS